MIAYVDASALAKLVLDEPGAGAMRRWYIESDRVISSLIGVIETRRAAQRHQHDAVHLDAVMRSVDIVDVDPAIVRLASSIPPIALKTLDAIHIATAISIGAIDAFVTYDDRQAEAARAAGLRVVRPA